MKFAIYPPEELIEEAVVTLPLSKSISTRALVFDALTQGVAACDSPGIAVCDDTAVITGALAVYAGQMASLLPSTWVLRVQRCGS